MRYAWLTGWATSPRATEECARAWCPAEHRVVVPGSEWKQQLAKLLGPDTVLCGYSTGAHLLLTEPSLWGQSSEVLLFAPFLHLRSDLNLGGRANAAVLSRWLSALPQRRERTISTFRRWVGLPADPDLQSISLGDLTWGLTRLLDGPPASVPELPFEAWLGHSDPLVDAQRLRTFIPRLHVVNSGHGLGELLRAAPRVMA